VHARCVRDLTILAPPLGIVVDGHDSADFISLRVSRRAIVTIVLIGGLAIAGLSSAIGERNHKGDRLQVASKHTSSVQSTVVTTLSRPPIGCEPAFSGLIDPKRSHVFGRCIS
jgi:hypothetical protein